MELDRLNSDHKYIYLNWWKTLFITCKKINNKIKYKIQNKINAAQTSKRLKNIQQKSSGVWNLRMFRQKPNLTTSKTKHRSIWLIVFDCCRSLLDIKRGTDFNKTYCFSDVQKKEHKIQNFKKCSEKMLNNLKISTKVGWGIKIGLYLTLNLIKPNPVQYN